MNARTLPFTILLGFSFATSPAQAACDHCGTSVGGTIGGNATWSKDGSPYCVTNDVYVAGNLIIREGVEVRFCSNYVFEVGGKIRVVGTESERVVFQPGDTNVGWQGLLFRDAVPGSYFVNTVIQGSKNSGLRITNTPPALTNCTILNNSSPAYGGGIYAKPSAGQTLILDGCIISNNLANPVVGSGYGYGGGIFVEGSLLLLQSTVVSNWTHGSQGFGGGVFVTSGDCTMRNCSVSGNMVNASASDDAVGVYFDGGVSTARLQMNNCIVASNGIPGAGALYSGGGVLVWRGTTTMENCDIVGNRRGGIYFRSGEASVINCTVVNNNVGDWGIYSYSATVGVTNSIVYYQYGANVGGNAVCAYSDVQGGVQPGPGNISFAPALCPENFSLIAGSPCIDAGDPALEYRDGCIDNREDCSPFARGTSRNDMGAYGGPGVCVWTDSSPEPRIRIQPDSGVVLEGDPAAIGVVASGETPLAYQWYVDGKAISKATNLVLHLQPIWLGNAGEYSVQVSNGAGSTMSLPASLMVSELGVTASLDQGKVWLTVRRNKPIANCDIYAADSALGPWTKIATVALPDSTTRWLVPDAPASGPRFYFAVPAGN